jgi:hypothetical protein
MCNNLHHDSKPIKEEGVGYKLVHKIGGEVYACVRDTSYSKEKSIWDKQISRRDGFCFFLSYKEAKRAQKAWSWRPKSGSPRYPDIMRIKYYEGLGKHIEKNFIVVANLSPSPEIALCKEFEFGKMMKKGWKA